MFELSKEEIKFLINEYDITRKPLINISTIFSSFDFIKTREDYYFLCEAACFRYQSSMVDNEYLHSINKYGHKININDVIIDTLNEVYEEPKDLSYDDQLGIKKAKIKLLTHNTTH